MRRVPVNLSTACQRVLTGYGGRGRVTGQQLPVNSLLGVWGELTGWSSTAPSFPRTAEVCTAVEHLNGIARQEAKFVGAEIGYAGELLPALPGRDCAPRPPGCRATTSPIPSYSNIRCCVAAGHREARPLTWQGAALIGMPYRVFVAYAVNAEALAAVTQLRDIGLGVSARPDLSLWNPDDSQLVIASPALLRREDAARFGFTSLGRADA
jgi:hypothetical protein